LDLCFLLYCWLYWKVCYWLEFIWSAKPIEAGFIPPIGICYDAATLSPRLLPPANTPPFESYCTFGTTILPDVVGKTSLGKVGLELDLLLLDDLTLCWEEELLFKGSGCCLFGMAKDAASCWACIPAIWLIPLLFWASAAYPSWLRVAWFLIIKLSAPSWLSSSVFW
jgi:hypothetical protein